FRERPEAWPLKMFGHRYLCAPFRITSITRGGSAGSDRGTACESGREIFRPRGRTVDGPQAARNHFHDGETAFRRAVRSESKIAVCTREAAWIGESGGVEPSIGRCGNQSRQRRRIIS